MDASTRNRWILVAAVAAVAVIVAGAWLLGQFRQPLPGFQFERLENPPEDHFVLNQTTYDELVPAVQEAIRDAVETGSSGTSLPEGAFMSTHDRLVAASRDQTGEVLDTFEHESTYLRYEAITP